MSTFTNVTLDDTSTLIEYQGSWSFSADPSAFNGTTHVSSDQSATATITFSGVAYYILAPAVNSSTGFTVTLDGVQTASAVLATGQQETDGPGVIVSQTDLEDGLHELSISTNGATGQILIDAITYTAVSLNATSDEPEETFGTERGPEVVAGSVIGGIFLVISLALLVWYLILRRKRQSKASPIRIDIEAPKSAPTYSEPEKLAVKGFMPPMRRMSRPSSILGPPANASLLSLPSTTAPSLPADSTENLLRSARSSMYQAEPSRAPSPSIDTPPPLPPKDRPLLHPSHIPSHVSSPSTSSTSTVEIEVSSLRCSPIPPIEMPSSVPPALFPPRRNSADRPVSVGSSLFPNPYSSVDASPRFGFLFLSSDPTGQNGHFTLSPSEMDSDRSSAPPRYTLATSGASVVSPPVNDEKRGF